jgi:prolyl-tRNA synthetase
MVGGLIMGHGDDNGLRLPPRLAPVQAVVILVREDEAAEAAAARLVRELEIQGVRVKLDAQTSTSFGRRLTDWELKGVPLRIEVGPREVAEGNVTLVRRDTNEKAPVAIGAVSGQAAAMLEQIQSDMLAAAMLEQKNHVVDVKTLLEALEAAQTGFARIPFEELGEDGEAELARSAVTVRCIQRVDGTVPLSEDEPGLMAVVARAY